MLKIKIPNNFLAERQYIIKTIFKDFLGLDYEIKIDGGKDYAVILENNKEVVIRDHFFSNFTDGAYLSAENIPDAGKLVFAGNEFIKNNSLPAIYGTDELIVSEGKIICGIDIFASCFFMLTRWEENVIGENDIYDRFPAKKALAHKADFLFRPIVNEYAEMLWEMLLFLKINQGRKEQKFFIGLTHDVDEICKYGWYPPVGTLKRLIEGKNFLSAAAVCANYAKVKLNIADDPFHEALYDYIIQIEIDYGFRSSFYFKVNGESYSLNDRWLGKFIKKLRDNDFEVGIHPSFNAYNNAEVTRKEKEDFEKKFCTTISGARQHFLKFKAPDSWRAYCSAGLSYDTTLGYADCEGFRSGTCTPFRPFDIVNRKEIDILEIPLIVMDGTLIEYKKISPLKSSDKIMDLLKVSKEYGGAFVLLWHNSYMTDLFDGEWKKCFEDVYQKIYSERYSVCKLEKICEIYR